MTRRWWILLLCCCAAPAAGGVVAPRLVSKTLCVESSEANAAVWVKTYYTQAQGQDITSICSTESASDVYRNWQQRFSIDNGKAWSAWEPMHTDTGITLTQRQPGWVDPTNGRMLQMEMLATSSWYTDGTLRYHVSTDGGHSFVVDQPVIQTGSQYNATHPINGVTVGQNSIQIAATTCGPIRTQQGKVLVPMSIIQPGDYSHAAVLIGAWNSDQTMAWDLSQSVAVDATKSVVGLTEPTITEMPDGRLLMVMRGGNGGDASIPGYKWYSVSEAEDGGYHWSDPIPWTYADGSNFYSPSSCSQFLKHSNGKYYWIGNICPTNTSGNSPRHPLVIGEVNPDSLLLEKDTVTMIDTVGPGDSNSLQLSNFAAYEDRLTHEIVVDVTRYVPVANSSSWQGDAYCYRIDVVPEPSSLGLLVSATLISLAYAWQRRNKDVLDH